MFGAAKLLIAAALAAAGVSLGVSSSGGHGLKPCHPVWKCPTTTQQTTTGTTGTTGTTTTVPTTVPTTTTIPTTTTQPTTTGTTTTTPPPPVCTKTLAAGGNASSFESTLVPGDVGCLHGGVYGNEDSTVSFGTSGSSSARITLQSVPGETATIMGPTYVSGSYITFTKLKFDVSTHIRGVGGNCPNGRAETFQIAGGNDILDHNEITASDQPNSSNGVYLSGAPNEIRFNKIHDVGACTDSTFGFDHGAYIGHGSGSSIHGNWIWNIHYGWGVQLYPDPSNTHIYSNVIDSARSGIIMCSSGNNHLFEHNVVSNDTIGAMISGCGPTGTGNVAQNNDAFNDPGGVGGSSSITKTGNVSIDPQYVNAAAHDYRVQEPSLASYGLWDGS